MGGIRHEFDKSFFHESIDLRLNVLAGNLPCPRQLRHRFGPRAVKMFQETGFPDRHLSLPVYLPCDRSFATSNLSP